MESTTTTGASRATAASPERLTATCAVCGLRIQRNGVRVIWRHQRPQPDGSPHDHAAKPPRPDDHECGA